jgi:hypothetical protein
MKLIYRGTTYNYNPANVASRRPFQHTRTSDSAYELIYRGNTYRVEPAAIAKAPVKPVAYELIYRGMTYWVNRNEQGEVTAITSSANPSKHRTLTAARPYLSQSSFPR